MKVYVFNELLEICDKEEKTFTECYSSFSEQIHTNVILTVKCFKLPHEHYFYRSPYCFVFYINNYQVEDIKKLYAIFKNNNYHTFDVFYNVINKFLHSYTKEEKYFFIKNFSIPKSIFYKNADFTYVQEEQKYCVLNTKKFVIHNIKNCLSPSDLVYTNHPSQKIIQFLKLIYIRLNNNSFEVNKINKNIYNNLTSRHTLFSCKYHNHFYIFVVENALVHMFYKGENFSHIYNGTLNINECFNLFPIKEVIKDFQNQYMLYNKLINK